jgi:hypothetical protein
MKRFVIVAVLLSVALAVSAADKPIITVLDLKVDGVSEKEMRSLVSLLSSALFQTGKYKVIDTTQRDTLLKEVAFSAADCTDETCQLEIGKMLSAEAIVVGTVGKLGSRFMLSAKMLQTETAETLAVADGVYPSLDAMVDGLPTIAGKLAGTQGTAGGSATPAARRPSVARTVIAITSLVLGVGSGGTGGYFLYDGAVIGKAATDAANAAYEAAGATDAAAKWDALLAASSSAKTKVYVGVGLAAGGVVLTGLGIILAIPPKASAPQSTSVSLLAFPAGEGAGLGILIRY